MSHDPVEAILDALKGLEEEEEESIMTTSVPCQLAVKIRDRIANEIPIPPVSTIEFSSIRALIRHAVDDQRFFDAVMPTLTGLTVEQFLDLAAKLPSE